MISAILLAAGLSSRYKNGNKLLVKIKSKELILHSLDNILKSKIHNVIVVIGKDRNKIRKILPKNKKIKIVSNIKYKDGLSSSIKYGLKYINPKSKYFFISLGDMPFFSYKNYNKMIEVAKKKKLNLLVPIFNKTLRNPVLFSNSFTYKLKTIKGDRGAKNLIKKSDYKKFYLNNEKSFEDFDTSLNFDKII